ncbi:hypothetical protein BCR35DRAFT_303379 [Leucosporidium creatinivorum]|uniref:Uncharacterized protein n=1 Tax=Leucosporidium creatinivorum TaxID=106004 RepID=A0A1Y2FHW6_9BASI|nr:hypothetical protein BCR35DRAFT_303379 [Leucosporidium creatinivorum]
MVRGLETLKSTRAKRARGCKSRARCFCCLVSYTPDTLDFCTLCFLHLFKLTPRLDRHLALFSTDRPSTRQLSSRFSTAQAWHEHHFSSRFSRCWSCFQR